MVTDLIARMDRWLASCRPAYYARLRPGVSTTELDQFEGRFGQKLPEAFRLLYQWRDGQESTWHESMAMNWMSMPLAEIATSKEMLDGMIGYDFEDPKWWRPGWVPFLDNGGGDHLCVDLEAGDGGTPGQLLTFWHDEGRRPIRFSSLEAWLQELVEAMESGTLELA